MSGMDMLKRKIRELAELADEIEQLGTVVIQERAIDVQPRSIADYGNPHLLNLEAMSDEQIAWNDYAWGVLTPDLKERQRKVLREYERWHSMAYQLIKDYLPERSEDFSKYYEYQKGKGITYGVIDFLKFKKSPELASNDHIVDGFVDVFERQRNILLSVLDVAEIKKMGLRKPNSTKGDGAQVRMKLNPANVLKIFFCYAHEDEQLLDKLKSHLRPLQREDLIDIWQDRDISAGSDWEREISEQLNTADIVLLLVSPDFMDSDYCYAVEMRQAIKRHEYGEAQVIPVILRPVYWQGSPFGKLQALPKDAKPVMSASWHSQDEAFFNVAEGIRKAVNLLQTNEDHIQDNTKQLQQPLHVQLSPKSKEQWIGEGRTHYEAKRYEAALEAYQQAIRLGAYLKSSDLFAMGLLLEQMGRLEDAERIRIKAENLQDDEFWFP